MPPVTDLRVRCVTTRPAIAELVAETLGTWLPGCVVEQSAELAGASEAAVHCIVLDAAGPGGPVPPTAGVPVVLLADAVPATAAEGDGDGADVVLSVAAVPLALAGVVVGSVAARAGRDAVTAARLSLEGTRRAIARGVRAASVQHAANNPLAALLTEAQLLELEPLGVEQLAAVRRIVELSRRTAAQLRELDGKPGAA